jgi:hypothetical protein
LDATAAVEPFSLRSCRCLETSSSSWQQTASESSLAAEGGNESDMEDDEAISLVVTALSVCDLFDTGNRSALDAFHCFCIWSCSGRMEWL